MMNSSLMISVDDIKYNQIHKYLINDKWNYNENFPNAKQGVYVKDDIAIVIPKSEEYIDFKAKLLDAFKTISLVKNISVIDIINEIKNHYIDRLSFRIVSESTVDGKISLSDASDITKAIKELIVATACTEENPRKFYKKATKSALKYSDSFKFAQTSAGSFIFNIESINSEGEFVQFIIDDNEKISENLDLPFERKILNRLAHGFKQINEFSDMRDIDNFVNESYIKGINSNMCEALLDMKTSEKDSIIETTINFAKNSTNADRNHEKIILDEKTYSVIKYINEYLKNEDINEHFAYLAKVSKVEHTVGKYVDFGGYATIVFDYDESNKDRHAKIYLEDKFYKIACDALKEQKIIYVEGTLNKSNRSWFIDDVTKFEFN
jgi:hypothetical protein